MWEEIVCIARMPRYCTNTELYLAHGDCSACAFSSYGRDCANNKIGAAPKEHKIATAFTLSPRALGIVDQVAQAVADGTRRPNRSEALENIILGWDRYESEKFAEMERE